MGWPGVDKVDMSTPLVPARSRDCSMKERKTLSERFQKSYPQGGFVRGGGHCPLLSTPSTSWLDPSQNLPRLRF